MPPTPSEAAPAADSRRRRARGTNRGPERETHPGAKPAGGAEFVVGFAFSPDASEVLLAHAPDGPAHVRGRITGAGGAVRPGEASHAAMVRAFAEATGVDVPAWLPLTTFDSPAGGFLTGAYAARLDAATFAAAAGAAPPDGPGDWTDGPPRLAAYPVRAAVLDRLPHAAVFNVAPLVFRGLVAVQEARLQAAEQAAEAAARRGARPTRPGIYLASRSHHGPRWLALRARGVPVVSSWIDECGPGETASYRDLWRRCETESAEAAALVCYTEPGDFRDGEHLKGALVELGVALGAGRPIFLVAPPDGYSFVHHPGITVCPTLADALDAARAVVDACSSAPQAPADADGMAPGGEVAPCARA